MNTQPLEVLILNTHIPLQERCRQAEAMIGEWMPFMAKSTLAELRDKYHHMVEIESERMEGASHHQLECVEAYADAHRICLYPLKRLK